MTDAPQTTQNEPEHQLRSGVLGLFDSVIMGIAGSAPAYSIAATTTALFGAVLYGGPAALLYCGIAMFGIVFAFNYLGRMESHAGASYSWVRRALHPILGFISGWSVVVSALIFMVIATFPADVPFVYDEEHTGATKPANCCGWSTRSGRRLVPPSSEASVNP